MISETFTNNCRNMTDGSLLSTFSIIFPAITFWKSGTKTLSVMFLESYNTGTCMAIYGGKDTCSYKLRIFAPLMMKTLLPIES